MNDKKGMPLKKLHLLVIIVLAILLASLVAYLVVSFVTSSWNVSWLIWIGCATAIIITLCVFAMLKFIKKGKFVIPRIGLAASLAMIFTLVYLCLITLVKIDKAWIMFLIMPIAITGADTVFSYWVYAKSRIVSLIAFILVATSLEYVILSLVELIKWHPYWLIPVAGVVISALIVVFKLREILNSKASQETETAEVAVAEVEVAEVEVAEEKSPVAESTKPETAKPETEKPETVTEPSKD